MRTEQNGLKVGNEAAMIPENVVVMLLSLQNDRLQVTTFCLVA